MILIKIILLHLTHILCTILEIENHRHPYSKVITGACIRFFIRMFLDDHTFLSGDSCAAKKRIIVLHVELILFIIFSTHSNSTVTSVIFRKLSIQMFWMRLCNIFLIIVLYYFFQNLIQLSFA